MYADIIDLPRLGERLAAIRRAYSDNIDLPNLESTLFATLLRIPAATYHSYERGQTEPTVTFLIALRRRTGVSLDWLLDLE